MLCLRFILVKESLAEEMIARFSLNKVSYECLLHYTHESTACCSWLEFLFYYFYFLLLFFFNITQAQLGLVSHSFSQHFHSYFHPFKCFAQSCRSRGKHMMQLAIARNLARNVNGIQCKAAGNADTNFLCVCFLGSNGRPAILCKHVQLVCSRQLFSASVLDTR